MQSTNFAIWNDVWASLQNKKRNYKRNSYAAIFEKPEKSSRVLCPSKS